MPEESNVIPKSEIVMGKQKSEQGYIGRPCREHFLNKSCILEDIKLARPGRGLYEAIGVSEEVEWPSLGDPMFASCWRTPEPQGVYHLRLTTWRETRFSTPAAWA
jgi:hypothetical protein